VSSFFTLAGGRSLVTVSLLGEGASLPIVAGPLGRAGPGGGSYDQLRTPPWTLRFGGRPRFLFADPFC
jgi:hypothetical protein